jgi:putative chitinase
MNITAQQLVDSHLTDQATAEKVCVALTEACERFGITEPNQIAMFLAQTAHESGKYKSTSENLNYKVQALMALFGRHRISEGDCHKYGRVDGGQNADQEGIANAIYGGEYGKKNLGNTEEGDGYKFRGAGYIQLTGRANFQSFSDAIGDPQIMENPRLVSEPKYAALSAAWFWNKHNLNSKADDCRACTKVINGGDIGLADREMHYKAALEVIGA